MNELYAFYKSVAVMGDMKLISYTFIVSSSKITNIRKYIYA